MTRPTALALLFLLPAVHGQDRFAGATQPNLARDLYDVSQPTIADVDNDGDLDVLVLDSASFEGDLWFVEQVGFGRFESKLAASLAFSVSGMVYGDVDGDGFGDVVLKRPSTVFGEPGVETILGGDGTGAFPSVLATFTSPTSGTSSSFDVDLVDLDGDGDLDLVQTGLGQVHLRTNQSGLLASSPVVLTAGLDPSDGYFTVPVQLDGDPQLELIVASQTQPGVVFDPALSGGFVSLPGPPACRSLVVGDVDGDGLDEIVLSRPDGTGGTAIERRAATLALPLLQQVVVPGEYKLSAIADLDGDGDGEALLHWAGFLASSGPPELLLDSAGPAGFTGAATDLFPDEFGLQNSDRATRVGDFDGDGDLDLVRPAEDPDYLRYFARLYLNDGEGNPVPVAGEFDGVPGGDQLGFTLQDLNGDGLSDAVRIGGTAPFFGSPTEGAISFANGLGGFAPSTPGPSIPNLIGAFEFGDLDADGDLDAFVGTGGVLAFSGFVSEPNTVLVGDGAGGLLHSPQLATGVADLVEDLRLFDADQDGDLDVFLGIRDTAYRLVVNDGSGSFTDASTQLPPTASSTSAVEVIDIDLDGDLDAVVAEEGDLFQFGMLALLENRPAGFVNATDTFLVQPVAEFIAEIRALELDGQPREELVIRTEPSFGDREILVFEGPVGSPLSAGNLVPPHPEPGFFAALDVEGDGDTDLVVQNVDAAAVGFELWRNDGVFGFSIQEFPLEEPMALPTVGVVAGDFDGDGDDDLFTRDLLLRGLVRELWFDSPAAPGQALAIEVRTGQPGGGYLLFAATGLDPLPIPGIGTSYLQLATTFPLANGSTDNFGRGTELVALPLNPNLLGITLYAQGLITAPFGLTRAIGTTISEL